jgi:hypothetical protein
MAKEKSEIGLTNVLVLKFFIYQNCTEEVMNTRFECLLKNEVYYFLINFRWMGWF